ncbi:hypothetical protein ACGF5T_31885 [Streptomyces sp. NPDC047853]
MLTSPNLARPCLARPGRPTPLPGRDGSLSQPAIEMAWKSAALGVMR